ncbi:hypothetical protein CMO84_05990 [Candidatus Woesearchaeota archaeon]|nr:hypothetical protein [Candidatus Woesearchaeota archaeon]MDP6739236.1 hypothetical protein [Planctomycetota bacterium]
MVIGITQEQHPDRCSLYAQWQGIDWPILWDPFNLTGSAAVPLVLAVDEAGVIRPGRLDVRRIEEQIVEGWMSTPPAKPGPAARRPYPDVVPPSTRATARSPGDKAQAALSRLLWSRTTGEGRFDGAAFADVLEALEKAALAPKADPALTFHHGVALRMRYDSEHRQAGDFQRALDAWMDALGRRPSQYIWRRRIQQWGPRLDKPYPFYDWVEEAQTTLIAADSVPHPIQIALSGAELASGTREIPIRSIQDIHPDPQAALKRDGKHLVELESTVCLHTGLTSKRVREPAGSSRIHLILRPTGDAHFEPAAGPARIWIEVPTGWNTPRQLLMATFPTDPDAALLAEFEVRPPQPDLTKPPASPILPATIHGTAFYFVCEGEQGECQFLAQDFEILIRDPRSDPQEPDK